LTRRESAEVHPKGNYNVQSTTFAWVMVLGLLPSFCDAEVVGGAA
jgi:hypothetical protein